MKRAYACPICNSPVIQEDEWLIDDAWHARIVTSLTHIRAMSGDCRVFFEKLAEEQEEILRNKIDNILKNLNSITT